MGEPFGYSPQWLAYAAAVVLRSQGFLDALAYGTNSAILERWQEVVLWICRKVLLISDPDSDRNDLISIDIRGVSSESANITTPPRNFMKLWIPSDVDIESTRSRSTRHSASTESRLASRDITLSVAGPWARETRQELWKEPSVF